MTDLGEFRERRLLVDELLAVEIPETRTVETHAEVRAEAAFVGAEQRRALKT